MMHFFISLSLVDARGETSASLLLIIFFGNFVECIKLSFLLDSILNKVERNRICFCSGRTCCRGRKLPSIVNRTFENRTQSNSIRGLSSIEFGNRTKSNTRLSVSSISEQIEFNRKNRTQSNSIHLIVFDWVRKPNSIEHN